MSRIDAAKATGLLEAGALLLDVRTPSEYERSHLDQAVNIPLQQLSVRLKELDRKRPVVLYCRSGARSASAASLLGAEGFEQVYDLGPMRALQPKGPLEVGSLGIPLLLCLTLGLAPFVPEPHLLGKVRWVAGGAVGMQAMDWVDLVFHGAPFLWLLVTALRLAVGDATTRPSETN